MRIDANETEELPTEYTEYTEKENSLMVGTVALNGLGTWFLQEGTEVAENRRRIIYTKIVAQEDFPLYTLNPSREEFWKLEPLIFRRTLKLIDCSSRGR